MRDERSLLCIAVAVRFLQSSIQEYGWIDGDVSREAASSAALVFRGSLYSVGLVCADDAQKIWLGFATG